MRILAAAAFAALLAASPARGEELLLDLSSNRVVIASNFTGTEVVLFGAILPDAASVSRQAPYDVMVTVRGPARDIVVRKKEQVFGIWINGASRSYPSAPSYLAVLSTRPVDAIAGKEMQEMFALGLRAALPGPRGERTPGSLAEEFADALLRQFEAAGLYREIQDGVTLLDANLFRATIPIPGNVPIGDFSIDVKLFSGGVMIAEKTTTLTVTKSTFEARVALLADHYALLYGIGASLLALLFGWLANVVFRRD